MESAAPAMAPAAAAFRARLAPVPFARPVAVVARELGINEASLGRWVNSFKARNDTGETAVTESERAELHRLRKENADLKLDRAFLKKASLFFAQEASDTNVKRSS